MTSDKKNINLLWTGGWDSTFQLLQLLLVHRCRVTPFYLIEEERHSTGIEILTMKRIKDRIFKEYPHTQELLQPFRYFSVSDISPDTEITEAYRSILNVKYIGIQYDWLARFCKENLITDIQLCIERHQHYSQTRFNPTEIVSESNNGLQTAIRIDPKFKMMSEYVLFQYFSFPIIKLTKIQMFDIAKKQGWENIMDMTWFCHTPTRRMKPCGVCIPCLLAIQDGLGWRVPLGSRISSFFFRSLIKPSKTLVKRKLSQLNLL
jgi:hypothetical protein